MDLTFNNKPRLAQCHAAFLAIGIDEALFMTHYELAESSEISSDQWKEFLTDPAVSEWLDEEIQVFTRIQRNKLIKQAARHSRSPGTAQMIGAIDKTLNKKVDAADGPTFIYSYVPLTPSQKRIGLTREEDTDIFWNKE